MNKPVVALLVLAIVAVAGFGVWANREPVERFCTLAAAIVEPPPGHEGAWVSTEDGGEPGRDHCDADPVPEPIADTEHLRLGFDCAFRDVDGKVVATTSPDLPGGVCGG